MDNETAIKNDEEERRSQLDKWLTEAEKNEAYREGYILGLQLKIIDKIKRDIEQEIKEEREKFKADYFEELVSYFQILHPGVSTHFLEKCTFQERIEVGRMLYNQADLTEIFSYVDNK